VRELRAENMMRWWWLSWLKKRRLANDEFILVNLLVYPPLDGSLQRFSRFVCCPWETLMNLKILFFVLPRLETLHCFSVHDAIQIYLADELTTAIHLP
jgi:hypothetical protein